MNKSHKNKSAIGLAGGTPKNVETRKSGREHNTNPLQCCEHVQKKVAFSHAWLFMRIGRVDNIRIHIVIVARNSIIIVYIINIHCVPCTSNSLKKNDTM